MKYIKNTFLRYQSTVFRCLLVVLLFFWLYCITAVTPFIRRSQGYNVVTSDARAEMTRLLGSCTVKN